MPWKKGQTKPMINAMVTGPRNSGHQGRTLSTTETEFFFFNTLGSLLKKNVVETEKVGRARSPPHECIRM